MRGDRASVAVAAAILLAACAGELPDGPQPTGIAPAAGYAGRRVEVRITGQRFFVAGVQDAGGGARVDTRHRAWLGATELEDVRWVDAGTLLATVPATLPPGTHDLAVEHPQGGRGVLPRAYVAVADAPPALSAALSAPASARVGHAFTAQLQVSNAGVLGAEAVAPTALRLGGDAAARAAGPDDDAAEDVAGGGTRAFAWKVEALAPGMLELAAGAAGVDPVTGAPVATAEATAAVRLTTPPALSVRAAADRSSLIAGETVTISVEVTNDGDELATAVSPRALDTGTGASVPAPDAPVDLPGHASASFQVPYQTAQAGTLLLDVGASGLDLGDGAEGVLLAIPVPVAVQVRPPPAALVAAATPIPARASVGQTFAVTLAVANVGGSDALVVPALAGTGGAVEVVDGPAPAEALVAPGASGSFGWTLRAAAPGPAVLTPGASATDASNPPHPLAVAVPPAGVLVQRPASLTAQVSPRPEALSVGQELSLVLTVADGGEADARVSPRISVPPGLSVVAAPPAGATIVPGGGTARLAWRVRADAPGGGTVLLGVDGFDANDAARAVSAEATAGPIATVTRPLLTGALSSPPPTVTLGQRFDVTLRVSNSGGAGADVTPALDVGADGVLRIVAAPARALVPGLADGQAFVWTVEAAAPGLVPALRATLAGADANDPLWPVSLTSVAGAVEVQKPPALEVSVSAAPDPVNRGRTITVSMVVRNSGGATVTHARPGALTPSAALSGALTGPAPADPVTLAAGAQQVFQWTCAAQAAGSIVFTGGATGADANTGARVDAAPGTSPAIAVQEPAAISLEIVSAPAHVNEGQGFTITVRATNGGDAGANDVAIGIDVAGATGGPAPASIALLAGRSRQTVSRTFTAGTARSTWIDVAETGGTDANDGAALAPASVSRALAIDVPAQLVVDAFRIDDPLPQSGTFSVSMVVRNAGGAAARDVAPSGPLAVASGTAGVTAVQAPPGGATLSSGQSATLLWTYRLDAPGSLRLRGTVQGVDANDQQQRTVTADSNLASTAEAVVLATDPFGGDGTVTGRIAAYAGTLWVGPSRDGARIVRLDPAGVASAERLAVAIRLDAGVNGVHAMRNTYWLSLGGPATTFGSSLCSSSDKASCGPDLEDGRATLLSGSFGGTEWLLAAGATTGGVRYVYATTSTASPLDFAWMDIRDGVVGAAKGIDSASVISDRLYVGYVDQSASRPALRVVTRGPSYPGSDSVSGTDSVELHADQMPYVGFGGKPSNPALVQGIDAVATFGGRLYLANNGGMMRSTVATPRPYDANPGDWASSTPAGLAAWTGRTAITLPASIEPLRSDRAVPALAAFAGRLYAPRNVAAGSGVAAQLWGCDPGADGACDPADWSLVAPGPTADLTQLGDATNEGATLLLATDRYLYLGFDNRTKGVQLFRTAAAAPAAIADFRGKAGCSAGSAGCDGVGGAGLGDPTSTRFIDAAVVRDASGVQHVYVVVGDPAAGQPLRIVEVKE